ncbi:MAG TPA: hypothetical protein DDW65_07795 [Firmicutes bacterium]|jgi:hypothetical protein|nr:hypothetical protein [Bacillota bacterium]
MSKLSILQDLSFGERVAEEESRELAKYFFQTEQWRRIFAGEIDVVYGSKGSGKSAIYSVLLTKESELFDNQIILIPAEKPRGTPVFRELIEDPPPNESQFMGLWKLYILSLIGNAFREYSISNNHAREVIRTLEESGLLEREKDLSSRLRGAYDYIKRIFNPESIGVEISVDANTGVSAFTPKITFREPNSTQVKNGYISIDKLFEKSDLALKEINFNIWAILDRLDVAFAETEQLEENALRALFKVYLDLLGFDNIRLKIFIRTDIWRRITEIGFREASHITRHVTISWDNGSLLNLIIRRILKNGMICNEYNVDPIEVLNSVEKQKELFYKIFPDQIEVGPNKSKTFEWMLSRTGDATKATAPRELIHLLNSSREVQLRKLELGEAEPIGQALFSRIAIKEALVDVSKTRLEQTIYAEYPNMKQILEKLEGEKTQQNPQALAKIWQISEPEAITIAYELVKIGFFEERGQRGTPEFWVPFLYRDALKMIQGTAEY